MPAAITLHAVDYALQSAAIHAVRQVVFVQGQGIDPALERDAADATAVHVLAMDADGRSVGTARMVVDVAGDTGRIGRMAVLADHRGQGIGATMLHWLEQQARQQGLGRLALHAQLPALPLYLRAGYLPCGPLVEEAGLPHQPLQRRLDGAMAIGDAQGLRAALACVIHTTARQLWLTAPLLDPGLLDDPLVLQSLRALAARRQPLTVQILVDDPVAISRAGGPVLALVQRLPSMFVLHQRDMARTASANALAVNDRGYCLLRPDAGSNEATAGLPWRPLAQRVQEQFQQDWASASACAELRPLRL